MATFACGKIHTGSSRIGRSVQIVIVCLESGKAFTLRASVGVSHASELCTTVDIPAHCIAIACHLGLSS